MNGGIYIGCKPKSSKIYCTETDTHTLCIGATRTGKSRCNVLPTICTLALCGESMIVSDPKSELYLYTYPFLKRCGYEVITLDFKEPRKSNRYNFLQPVIDAVNSDDIPLAITKARDISAMLSSGESGYSERIWSDGERAMLTCGILAVVYDNKDNPQYQNLTNVYHFLGKMCKSDGNVAPPIIKYLDEVGIYHPAAASLDISEIAPSKMRGSFYTSALVALEIFTTPDMYYLTSKTDFDMYVTGKNKRAIFIILPDNKETFYKPASLFVYQHYSTLADEADKIGGRLERRANFILDEFGNFAKIPDFQKHITVGGGRGIRYSLYLQDFNQLDNVYGDKVGKIIRANCETWVFLSTDNPETRHEISEKLGKYTVKAPSASNSSGGSSSSSYNLTSRNLLNSDEIGKIIRPWQIVMTRNDPAIMYAPDISETVFNAMLGLGSMDFNTQLLIERNHHRKEVGKINPQDIAIWRVWERYTKQKSSDEDIFDVFKNQIF